MVSKQQPGDKVNAYMINIDEFIITNDSEFHDGAHVGPANKHYNV